MICVCRDSVVFVLGIRPGVHHAPVGGPPSAALNNPPPLLNRHFLFCLPHRVSQPLTRSRQFHVVGIDAALYDEAEEYIHHLVVKGFPESGDCHGNCSIEFFGSGDTEIDDGDCDGFAYADIYGWAPGVAGLAMPDDVGFRFGSSGYRSIGE